MTGIGVTSSTLGTTHVHLPDSHWRPCVIFDLDGTLADNSHRLHYIQQSPRNWAAYNAAMILDEPIMPMVHLARALAASWPLVLMTGRPLSFGEQTICWLQDNNIPHELLLMRLDNDHRQDTSIKREHLQYVQQAGLEPMLVIEDRTRMIAMWRAQGFIALQCAEGNY